MSRHGGALLRARWSRRLFLAALGAAALIVGQVASGASMGFTLPATAAASGPTGHPNRFSPAPVGKVVNHLPPPPATPNAKAPLGPPRIPPVPMQPALVALDPVAGAHFRGSDGMLELSVPGGAVTAADVTAAGGGLSLVARQILPASGSNAGGSGRYTFGTWLVQVVDAAGRPAARGLRKPLSVRLHVAGRAGALDLAHVGVTVNAPLPSWVNLDPASVPQGTPASGARRATPAGGTAPKPALGAFAHQAAALDASSMALTATVAASSPSTGMSFNTDAPVATFGRPDPFEADLSAGALSAGIKLDVPSGPGGLTPPLELAYNSSAVNDQHNAQAVAPWVGLGWNLGLGSISWAEHNVETVNPNSTPLWEDSWQLSDPFGTAADLVPPNINVATFNEDSGNAITPSPIPWHTAPETRAKVISFQSPVNPEPCFRVFLPTGIMEEFGCTGDALQWYPGTGNQVYIANWLLDLITDPQGNQIHVTYQRDYTTTPSGFGYTRDIVPATVEWDSPGCRDAQNECTGSAWSPLMRVNFAASHTVDHVNGSSCGLGGPTRCDDPVDLSPNGLPAPLIQSTFVLNDIQVQVRSGAGAGWATLRTYQLSYDQGAQTTAQNPDPVTGKSESVAGRLLLSGVQEHGDDATAFSSPAVAVRSNGEVDVVAQGPNNALVYSWSIPGSSWASATIAGPGSTYSAPAIVVRPTGEVDVVAQGPNNSLAYYVAFPGTSWASTTVAGGSTTYSAPAIFVRSNGEADIAAQGPSNSLVYYWATPGSPWQGTTIWGNASTYSAPAIFVRSNGEADVVAMGLNNVLGYYWAVPGSAWQGTAVASTGSTYSAPAIFVRSSGEADITAQGANNSLAYYWATPGSQWQATTIAGSGTTYSAPGIFVRSSDEADIVTQGAGNALMYYAAFPGHPWSAFPIAASGAAYSAPAITVDANGKVSVPVQGPGSALTTYWATPGSQWTADTVGAGSSTLPPLTMSYGSVTEYYEDSLGAPQPSGNCGPSWNNGITPNGHTGCVLWSQSYAGNSSYLVSMSNGQGMTESFQWTLAHNNFHGVVSGSVADPTACESSSVHSTYPCNMPDDGSWSRVVLTQRKDSVAQLTQSGQGGTQTQTTVTSQWNYSYQVRTPLPAQECGDCVASFYWGKTQLP